ncbi:TonB-dependent receptor [Aestuariivivens sediminicola]|uniref:TonB-dependent receptor n=1 Tax=Aestuariivivens sediminicola TaxID=2913560 RepID=UPI001F594DDF|nr:TonB-dependent receptor plug domain-containing protein [Aestuariivivens sediminicola]
MKGTTRKFKTFLFMAFLLTEVLSSQEVSKKYPLSEVLGRIESKYDIKFNYADDIVSRVEVRMPDNSKTLIESLKFLERQTFLNFELISQNIVLISPMDQLIYCGTVINKSNLQPIENAVVSTEGRTVFTNEKGFYQLELNNTSEEVSIGSMGFKTAKIKPSSFGLENCEAIFLEPNFQTLSEVIISNYLVNGINKINNGSFEIDFSNFKILPGLIETDVLHSVQALPGIQSINETVSNINVRGGTHDQNLILWDNIKMYQSGHFFGLISMYNPQITKKVLLHKNGSSASRTDGVSGTIDMQTEKKLNSKFKGSLGINLTNMNGFFDVPLGGKSSIQIAARKSINEFLETPTYTAFFDRISQNTELNASSSSEINNNKTFDFYDTSLRWLYKISDRDQLQVNFIYVHNELIFDENLIENQSTQTRESSLVQNSIAEGLNYSRIWNDTFKTTLEVYETDYNLEATNVNIQDNQRFLQKNKVSEGSVKLNTFYNVNRNLQWLNGYHFVETKVTNLDDVDNPLFRNLISEVLRTHGIFTEFSYRSANRLTALNVGMRFNYIGKFNKQIWEPRLSFSQKFFDGFSWEVQGEFKHQNTSQIINFQNDFLGIEKRRWQLANNDNIPVIRGRQISTGINYNNSGWLFNIDLYLKKIKGITSQSQGFQNQFEFIKTSGNYSVFGLDLLFRKQIKHLSTWLSYSYMDNNYEFKALEENQFPSNYNIEHNINIGSSYSLEHLKLSAGLEWRTGRPTTTPIEGNTIVDNEINFNSPNNASLKDYLRIDLSATYDFNLRSKNKMHAGISVWNLLDRKNEINNFYVIRDNVTVQTVQRSLGFTPNAFLRYNF